MLYLSHAYFMLIWQILHCQMFIEVDRDKLIYQKFIILLILLKN